MAAYAMAFDIFEHAMTAASLSPAGTSSGAAPASALTGGGVATTG
ncbi:hypothetical protein L829_3397 [Mycobacteroides abscessus MAB_030201_1075]|uniref:Uncharacterized protein n=2 Tax=Mycobacteroides abscessus TaxID=36809 RepID=A0A829PRG9_9MYCO|nr:hypothetical protein L829_3397 [Mycobacteroides abscessus MAB_030201_1075]